MRANGYQTAAIQCLTLTFAVMVHGEMGVVRTGPVTLVQVDPHHEHTVLAATATAQLFRSRDEGDTWSPIPFPGSLRSNVHAMLIDRTTANEYLVAASSDELQYAGIFRTMDEGVTWEPLPGMERKQVWALASWAGDPRVIAAGAQDGVFLSRDGGENWTHLSSPRTRGPQPVVSLAFDPKDSKTLYAGTPHLAWKTADGGTTWHRLPTGMQDDSDVFSIDVHEKYRSRLFAGACSGIYRSLNGGGTWTSLEHAIGGQHRTYVITRAPRNPEVVFAGTSIGLIQSPDGGTTWRKLSEGPARSIAFDPADPQRIFVATDGGILRSDDSGVHFRETNPAR